MTHERARLVMTFFSAIVPLTAMALIGLTAVLAPSYLSIVALLFILSVLCMIGGHVAFTIATALWKCSECGRLYLSLFMPYWRFG